MFDIIFVHEKAEFFFFFPLVFGGFQRMDMVYFTELRSAVDKNLERFLKSCIFYFIRNTKGEMLFFFLQ